MKDEIVNRRLMPRRAIIVYSDKAARNFYLENHDITKKGDNYNFGAAIPMADDMMKDIAKTYMQKNAVEMEFSALLSPYLLHGSNRPGTTMVVWYRPSQFRTLHFSKGIVKAKELPVKVPATLYAVVNTRLYIYALMSDERPTAKTKLYHAPFCNVYKDGNVCLGSARIGKYKAKTFEVEAERFERGFYLAEQTHTSGAECKTPILKLWQTLIGKKTAFPSRTQLVQHGTYKTVADLFHKVLNITLSNNG